MYSVHCETCSEETTVETYAEADEFFQEHAELRHEVELVRGAHADHLSTLESGQPTTAD